MGKDASRGQTGADKGSDGQVYQGLGVSAGIATGQAHVVESDMAKVPEYRVSEEEVEAELERFAAAAERSRRQLRRLRTKAAGLSGAVAEELDFLLSAHQQMLTGSRLVRGVEARIQEGQVNAESAVQAEISEIAKAFSAVSDPYLAGRIQDIRDVGVRLIRNLTKTPFKAFADLPKGSVIVAHEISPADTALMDPARVAGFTTATGGPESHTAIMARSLGIPAVMGATGVTEAVRPGDRIIVDGTAGVVVIRPNESTIALYERRRRDHVREQRILARLKSLPAVTRDDVRMTLQANIELPVELEAANEAGAEGIGLLRSEFMFMNREDLPSEQEQYESLRQAVDAMQGKPVTVRTLDVGGDKLAAALVNHYGEADNPALGLRAIRFSLKVRPIFETQLAAILRAGAHGPVRILLPMITSAAEVRAAREIVLKVAKRLRRRRARLSESLPPIGVMIEVPGAALAADSLATAADFFSIGTNDLTMYTLAIDRGNDQVADLYDPLHPAVLRLIQFTIEAALRARVPVSLCGEMAGDPRYTALLLGLGLRDLSMVASSVLKVKKRIRSLDLIEATRRARNIMDQSDSGRIAALLDDFNALA